MNASDYVQRRRCCGYTPPACCCPTTIDVSCQPIIDISFNPVIDVSCTAIIDPSSVPIVVDVSGLTPFTNSDAFARLRVANPYTLFEFNVIGGANPYLMQSTTSGTGSLTADTVDTYVELAIAGAGEVIYQSREYVLYQPGKSKLVMMTGILYMDASATAGVTTRIGCFDASMGIYIEMEDGILYAVQDNTIIDRIAQSAWNRDPLDGTGPSGITVDFTKAQIFWWDYEWLGVGQVRAGVIVNGVFVTYHVFEHFNVLVFPYIQMAKLPLRYQILGTGTNAVRVFCGTVISEGGISPIGQVFTYGNFTSTGVQINSNNPQHRVPIIGIRLRNTVPYNRVTLKLKDMDLFSTTTASAGSWQLLLNPTISGATGTWTNYSTLGDPLSAQSAVQYIQYATIASPTPTNVVGGHILYSGFYSQRANVTINQTTDELIAALAAGTNIAGTVADEIILVANVVANAGAAPAIFALLRWIEFL